MGRSATNEALHRINDASRLLKGAQETPTDISIMERLVSVGCGCGMKFGPFYKKISTSGAPVTALAVQRVRPQVSLKR
jgi:hypothetical protein